jgi:hypothetical protein
MYPVPSGARHPRWSPDGTQLFFGQGPRIFGIGVSSQPKFTFGTPTLLVREIPLGAGWYDVVADGKRFVGITVAVGHTPITAAAIRQIDVVLNWHDELKTRRATVK